MGGTSRGRPVTSSSSPTGANSSEPRPGPSASFQPLPCSKPRAEKRLVRRSNSAPEAMALTNMIPLIIDSIVSSGGVGIAVVAGGIGLDCRWEMPVNYETLLCEVKDQVARVTLNRPDVLNALNSRVFNELEHAFMTFALDASVRAVLVTGAGEKAFAAGADINEILRLDVATGQAKAHRGQEVFRAIET